MGETEARERRQQQVTCTHYRLGETSVYQLAPEGSTEPESTREGRALCLGAHCYAATAVLRAGRGNTHKEAKKSAGLKT